MKILDTLKDKAGNSLVAIGKKLKSTAPCEECDGSGISYFRAPYTRQAAWYDCSACEIAEKTEQMESDRAQFLAEHTHLLGEDSNSTLIARSSAVNPS